MSKFLVRFLCEFNSSYSVIIEDDGRVCYAYLLNAEDEIITHVWLYNQRRPPDKAKWDRRTMPFLNPTEFLVDNNFVSPIKDGNEIDCEWDLDLDSEILKSVKIFLRGDLLAKLGPGTKPGWSKLVKKDGPVTKVLV